jgi:hypothetical protein
MSIDQPPPPPPPPPRDDRPTPKRTDNQSPAPESTKPRTDSLDRGTPPPDAQARLESYSGNDGAAPANRSSGGYKKPEPEPPGLEAPERHLRPSPEMQQHLDDYRERKAARAEAIRQGQTPDPPDRPPERPDDPTGAAPKPASDAATTPDGASEASSQDSPHANAPSQPPPEVLEPSVPSEAEKRHVPPEAEKPHVPPEATKPTAPAGVPDRSTEPTAHGPAPDRATADALHRDPHAAVGDFNLEPPVDKPSTGDPFYRQVSLNSHEISDIEAKVDARVAAGEPGRRDQLIEMEKNTAFEGKARNGEFFSPTLQGSLESMMDNATASEFYGDSAYLETRLYEVRPTVGTDYYEGNARPQGPNDPTNPAYAARPLHAALPGEGTQVFIPDKSDRESWSVHAIARNDTELADLPEGSIRGFDENRDLIVSPDVHHADHTVKTHTVVDENPFEQEDADAQAKATEDEPWKGPYWNRFSGNITQKVVGGAESASGESLGDPPHLSAEERDAPGATSEDDADGAKSHVDATDRRAARDHAMAARLESTVEELRASDRHSPAAAGSADGGRQESDPAPFDPKQAGLRDELIHEDPTAVGIAKNVATDALPVAEEIAKELARHEGIPPFVVDEATANAEVWKVWAQAYRRHPPPPGT